MNAISFNDLSKTQVQSTLKFYDTYRTEIDSAIAAEQALEIG